MVDPTAPVVLECTPRELRCPACRHYLRRIALLGSDTTWGFLTICERKQCRQHILVLGDGERNYTISLDRDQFNRLLDLPTIADVLSDMGMKLAA